MIPAPPIDSRTEEDVLRELRKLQRRTYVPGQTGLDAALARIFARYCAIIISRLNQVPGKLQLAFFDLLGVSPLPAQPARAPLTFYLVPQATADVLVPARTQVAAQPAKGDTTPLIFETEEDLPVSSLRLDSVFTADGETDQFADYCGIIGRSAAAMPILRGNRPNAHLLFIGLHLPRLAPVIAEVRLVITLDKPASAPLWLSWEIWDGTQALPLSPADDTTAALSKNGEIVFADLPPFSEAQHSSVTAHWLRCRLLTPITPEDAAKLPVVGSIQARVRTERRDLRVEQALWNAVALDLSKDYYPFGERPHFGDTFFLANDEAFSSPGAAITLSVQLTNPAAGGPEPPVPRVASSGVQLLWEYWDGWFWSPLDPGNLRDDTRGFTQSGDVTFRLPQPPAPLKLVGQQKLWIRARIVFGDYRQEVHPVIGQPPAAPPGPSHAPPVPPPAPSPAPSHAPPMIKAILVNYSSEIQLVPAALIACNLFECREFNVDAGGIVPFAVAEGGQTACYFGFAGPERHIPRALNLYFAASNPVYGAVPAATTAGERQIVWEYWNGLAWTHLAVIDNTEGLRSSGLLQCLLPADAQARREFSRNRLWLRLKRRGPLDFEPRVRAVLPNTVMASHAITILNEMLGSSNGRPWQMFRTSQTPVLEGQQLEVLESQTQGGLSWIPWREIGGFHGSGPDDRHYQLDRIKGEVLFGDGVSGAIPPARTANIRLAQYRAGGGARGNLPAGSITQLKTTVPYVERVDNLEPATGGAEGEAPQEIVERAPRELRHRGRAVTAEDYEDLARQASTEVARAKCLSLRDLASDPEGATLQQGVVSLILVPRSEEPCSMPSLGLFDRVRRFLDEKRPCTASLVLSGPDYLRIDIRAEVCVSVVATAGEIEQSVIEELRRYLHPTKGRNGAGWEFGQLPQQAELYALIEASEAIDHVSSLDIKKDSGMIEQRGRFLVCPGDIAVTMILV